MIQKPQQSYWLQKRRQRRRRLIIGRTAFIIIGLSIATVILTVIGLLFTVQGGTILAVVGIITALVAWLFPLSPNPASPTSYSQPLQPISLQSSAILSNYSSSPPRYDSVFHPVEKLPDPKSFYGRESERRTLINRTRNKNSTSIVGPRRIGKTWLMQFLSLVAETDLGVEYRVIFVDVTSARCETVAGFVEYVLSELKFKVKSQPNALMILDVALRKLDHEKQKSQSNVLVVMEQAIQDLSRESIVPVVCIDEFRGLFDTSNRRRYLERRKQFNMEFFKSLRVMCMSSDMNFVLVVASQNPLKKIVGRVGQTSRFFNVFNQITVKPFNLEEAEEFVQTKGDQAQFDDIERDYMLKLSRQGGLWAQYWPIVLETVGQLIEDDKKLPGGSYHSKDRNYRRDLKKRLQEKLNAVM